VKPQALFIAQPTYSIKELELSRSAEAANTLIPLARFLTLCLKEIESAPARAFQRRILPLPKRCLVGDYCRRITGSLSLAIARCGVEGCIRTHRHRHLVGPGLVASFDQPACCQEGMNSMVFCNRIPLAQIYFSRMERSSKKTIPLSDPTTTLALLPISIVKAGSPILIVIVALSLPCTSHQQMVPPSFPELMTGAPSFSPSATA
jgi:hypothetical protein